MRRLSSFGFSDPAPRPQIISDVVDDLHAALKAGSIPEPYVLVGHSLGGWEPGLADLPTRSRLYPLAAVGIGTAQTECLTSYLMRLAAAHCLSPGTLYGYEIYPLVIDEPPHSSRRLRLGSEKIIGAIHAAHCCGADKSASSLVRALERLTCVQGLHLLTWLPGKLFCRTNFSSEVGGRGVRYAQRWIVESLGELVARAPELSASLSQKWVTNNLEGIISRLVNVTGPTFAELVSFVTLNEILREIREELNLPTL